MTILGITVSYIVYERCIESSFTLFYPEMSMRGRDLCFIVPSLVLSRLTGDIA